MATIDGNHPIGLQAAAQALEETDHTRLPSWMVARIAVLSATKEWRLEYENRVVKPLREENNRLRAEVEHLRAHLRLRLSAAHGRRAAP
jgi:hypothetical protein